MRVSARWIVPLVLFYVLIALPSSAGDWQVLGQRMVNNRTDRDVITVTGSEGKLNAVKVKVLHEAVEFIDLKIFFANGGVQDVSLRRRIPAGGDTRVIDLTGGARVVRKVELLYRSRNRRPGKGAVQLLGRSSGPAAPPASAPAAPAPASAPAPAPAPGGSWQKLGERTVQFRTDRDVIPVTGVDGTFRKIKLKVLRNSIEVLDLKVIFGNGESHGVSLRRAIRAGGETRVINLPGGERVIKRVELVYRSTGPKRGRAVVRLWGLH